MKSSENLQLVDLHTLSAYMDMNLKRMWMLPQIFSFECLAQKTLTYDRFVILKKTF